jgi:flagellar biosynthesis protein
MENNFKTKEAAALKYSPDNADSPRLIAIGRGEVADRIIETAKKNDVPVYEDESLAHTLSLLKIGDLIPAELYEVVARILVFVSKIDLTYGERYGAKREDK